MKVVSSGLNLLIAVLLTLGASALAQEGGLPTAEEIVQKVNALDQGISLTRTLTITMKDKHGKERKQVTKTFRKYFGDEKRSAIFYVEPANIKDTAFLTFDYPEDDKDDDQWLYLPSLRRVRRISSANRGDYYLGTDFTYEDMKQDTRLSLADYAWELKGKEELDGHACYVIEGKPVSDKIGDELGYSKYVVYVDAEEWIQRSAQWWDVNGNALKTTLWKWEEVDGRWAAVSMNNTNHKTGHSTLFEFSNIDFATNIPEDRFTERALKRGVRGN